MKIIIKVFIGDLRILSFVDFSLRIIVVMFSLVYEYIGNGFRSDRGE